MKNLYVILKQNQGVTAVEFALLAPTLFLILFGIIEFSMILFSTSVIESSTNISARLGRTGNLYAEFVGDYNDADRNGAPDLGRDAFIRSQVQARSMGLLQPDELIIESQTYAQFQDIRPGGLNSSAANGFGASGEAVLYRVSYDWPVLTPLLGNIIGDSRGRYRISSALIVKNEDF